MRDLSRASEDMKILDKQLRQRLNGFLLRHGRIYNGRGRWTQAHWCWAGRATRRRSARPSRRAGETVAERIVPDRSLGGADEGSQLAYM